MEREASNNPAAIKTDTTAIREVPELATVLAEGRETGLETVQWLNIRFVTDLEATKQSFEELKLQPAQAPIESQPPSEPLTETETQ